MKLTRLLGVASAILLAGAAVDPARRYVYLFFAFIGLVGTLRAHRTWRGTQTLNRHES